ncbi:MAG: M61 family metallopeptidase, partial [Gammaproteobacteria bacterium]
LEKICTTQIRLFGEPAPMDRYLFMVQVVGDGYGGLEHRSSTSLLASRDDLPLASDEPGVVRDAYRTFLGLCSHEYFHSWNVKRIKPAAFVPYDLSREAYTPQLWMFEGFTSYYDDLVLVRAGVISPASYLELLGQNLTRVLRTPGRHKQSVAESSFDAWTKFYRQDENAPNALVSYYAKGAVVALALDLEIRRATQGRCSLDDVMRLLWLRHGQTGLGVEDDGVQRIAEEVAGVGFDAFFAQAVYGTDDLALDPLLAPLGIELRLRAADGQSDKGGKPGRDGRDRLSIGARLGADAAGAKILNCFDEGAAMRAGLSAGDVIVAVDGLRATAANIDKLIAGRRAGELVEVHAFRRDELRLCRLVLASAPQDTCWLVFAGGEPSPAARRWLLAS